MDAQIIDITPLHTGSPAERPKSTLTITRRTWTEEEQQRLARILFGPRPGEEAA
ncbi:hypothetical protein [Streptomyces sp. NPDC002088]|uniref:hypothetical protein n=1 Tax=Streptomyces sp. NPDC002088 TaxID=3154665 RepID=UPI003331ECAD